MAGSPYIVVDSVTINSGATLVIEPGVEVRFNEGKALQVDGGLVAQGTVAQPITFTSNLFNPEAGDWGYVLFTGSSLDANFDIDGNYIDGSILQYCTVEYAGYASSIYGAVRLDAAAPFINHCTIHHNGAGGIYAFNNSAPRVTYNTVSDNSSSTNGGGIYASGPAVIEHNTVSDNSVDAGCYGCGGGIYAANATVSYNMVGGNTLDNTTCGGGTGVRGAGIYAYTSTVSDNTVTDNTANGGGTHVKGGGIYANGSSVSDNTVTGNSASAGSGNSIYGAGIYAESNSTVSSNIVAENTATSGASVYGAGVYFYSSGGAFSHNTVAGNEGTAGSGTVYGAGVYFRGSPTFSYNAIAHNTATSNNFVNGAGVYLHTSATVEKNTIVGNSAPQNTDAGGVYLYDGQPSFNRNNLYGNSGYEFYNNNSQGEPNVNATSCYWGTTVDATIAAEIYDWYDNASKGIVDYIPFLDTPDPDAPTIPEPDIQVTPLSFDVTLEEGQTATRPMTITNQGDVMLTFGITDTVDGQPFDWLSETPNSGSVDPGGSQVVEVTFNAGSLTAGTYNADIVIDNNDPDENPTTVPVTLTVTSPPEISDVRTTNVRDPSFTVSWLTDVEAGGEVHYGTNPANLDQIAYDVRGTGTFDDTHYVTLQELTPNTTYYFDVVSGSTTDDNDGAHYTVTTGPTLGLPGSDAIYGQVFKEDETTPAEGTIVYITLRDANGSGSTGEAAPLSALVDNTGYWNLNLGNARLADLSGYFEYSASGDKLKLDAQGASDGTGYKPTVDTDNDSPAPTIVLSDIVCVEIPLQIGWNHISLPLEPVTAYTAQSLCDEIISQGGDAVEIDRWYAGGWDSHICGLPFNDFDIELGSDYFIKSNAASTWTICGYVVTTAVPLDLQIGWNSIGLPHTDAYTAQSLCDEIIGQGVTAVEIDRWHAGGWDSHICGLPFNNFAIEIGKGYFVKAGSAGTVTPTALASQAQQVEPAPAARPQAVPATAVAIGDLQVSDLRDTAATLSWITDQPATGYVVFGETPALNRVAYDVRGAARAADSHYIVLTGLAPETTYYFDIVSGAGVDDNGGVHYTVTTGPMLESLPESDAVYGQVFWANRITPAAGTIVYLTLMDDDGVDSAGEAMLMSALVDEDGWWQANLGNARLAGGSGSFVYSTAGDTVTLVAQGMGVGLITQTVDSGELRPAAPLKPDRQYQFYLPLISR